jgi:regulation of enolase protein 1 (concanavalin A-like superfamily)
MFKKTLFRTFMLLLLAIAPAAQAGVLYYDNFDGPAGVDLQNTTPDISVGGAIWQAGAWVNADGTYGGGSANQMFSAALPFTPIIGAAYELSAVVDNQGDWMGIAFMNAAPGVGTRLNDNAPLLWALTRQSGSTAKDQAFIGPGATNGLGNTTTTSAAELKVRIEMNSATNWLVTWYFDGSQQFQRTVNPAGTPSIVINYVAFGGNGMFSALTGTISSFKLVEIPQALKPNPSNGSLAYTTTVNLQWQPGIYAAKHDVYFGESFDDVNNATTSTPAIYKGRQDPNNYTVTGLTPGKTYYWRIDGVDNNGTIDRGEVWNFNVQPLIAYNPSPPDGAKYLDFDVNLAWTPGSKAKLHDVYLGTNLNDVSNARGTSLLGVLVKQNHDTNSYDPGTLALGRDYYWRIDEVNTPNIWTGDVWRFTIMPDISITNPALAGWWKLDEGQGIRALDWSGHGNHGILVNSPQWAATGQIDGSLQFDGINDNVSLPIGTVIRELSDSTFAIWVNFARIGAATQRIFDFGTGADAYMYLTPGSGGGGGAIQFSITAQGGAAESQLIAPFSLAAGWHHLAVVIDSISRNMQLYLDGDVVISGLTQTLPKDLGNTTQNWLGRSQAGDYTWFTGFLDDFRIYNRVLSQIEIERIMTGDPALASNPRPANGASADIEHAKPLSWLPGENAVQHDVYFGTDANAVGNADISDTTGLYRGRQDPNTYTPPEELKINQTYYWRIDEINADAAISKGKVWSFTISEYLIVDDFEDYGDVENRIYDVWADYYVNNTGMTVGHFDPPFAERTVVYSGLQAMYMRYDNDGTVNEGTNLEKTGTLLYSEAERRWDDAQDWTRMGVNSLTLWFRGIPASVGSFTAGPPIKMTAAGADIWGTADQFHFAYKQLSGVGSITAKVSSVSYTDSWTKAGVMIRESLAAGSKYAMVAVTPGNGVVFQNRPEPDAASAQAAQQAGITAPQWLRLTRSGNTFTAEYSANGTTWTTLGSVEMPMLPDVYIGLIACSHNVNAICTAEFSNVSTSGTGDWQSQDIGIQSNVPEGLYVVLQDSTGISSPAVKNSDPAATTLNIYTPWTIPLTSFTGQATAGSAQTSVNLQTVKKLTIGVGDRANTQPGGSGDLYIDDIGLQLPR